MGSCTRRHFLLSTCFLQMITIIERQVFDFLGYMWAPIFVNFLQILFIIFGFYGAYHFRIKYILTYLSWCFLWIGWNAFLICFYMDVGELNKDSDLLNLGTGSVSWFEVNGYGCKPIYPMNITSDDPFRPIRPERVDDCLLSYPLIEVIHSGVQCALALFGILGAILISYIFLDEDDRFDFMNGDAKSPQHTVVHPMYVSYTSIPTSASATMLSSKQLHNPNHHNHHNNHNHPNHQNHLHHLATNHQQPHSYSNNTFLTHSNSNTPNASKNNTLTSTNRNLYYSPKNNQCFTQSSATTIMSPPPPPPPTTASASAATATVSQLDVSQQQLEQRYYDDSTAKADHQLYTNSQQQRQQLLMLMATNALSPTTSLSTSSSNTAYQQQQQQQQHQRQQQHNIMNLSNANINTNNYYYNNNNNTTNTNSSLSYASLQKCSGPNSVEFLSSNSNSNLTMAGSVCSNAAPEPGTCVGGGGVGVSDGLARDTLSSSNYSITNSLHGSSGNSNSNNNNNNNDNNTAKGGNRNNNNISKNNNSSGGNGRFARIHAKPKAPKSSYYNNSIADGNKLQQHHRYDMPTISNTPNDAEFEEHFQESLDDDIISVQNFKSDAITYIPFQKPVPSNNSYLSGSNNNPSYASLNSIYSGNNNSGTINSGSNNSGSNSTATPTPTSSNIHYSNGLSPNNNNNNNSLGHLGQHLTRDNSHFFMRNNNDLLLERQDLPPSSRPSAAAILNPATRALYQQNGLPFLKHQPYSNPSRPSRPSNIPLPTVPHLSSYPHSNPSQNTAHSPVSPSAVTPPPPPAPRPHIFTPRLGHAPYPDLSPEVAEKYAMPTQYVPRSPVPSRIARRQRQQHERERSHFANTSANFCDQIRDAPPGYIGTGLNITRAKSYDRLCSSGSSCKITGHSEHRERLEHEERSDRSGRSSSSHAKTNLKLNSKDAAPQVNRRSGRSGVKARPRSYCNSMVGVGEGVIRNHGASADIGVVVGRSGGMGDVVYS